MILSVLLKIERIVEKKHHNLVGIFNTICYTTKVKQDEARALAEKSDAVLVLGSRTSANTRRLYEVAKEVNPNTFFAQDANEALNQTKFIKDIQSVSIVAGASTPPWLIQEVTRLMSETQKNAVETVETEVKNEATLQEQPVEEKEPTTMADLLKSATSVGYTNYKVGKRIKGKVISAGDSGIYVAIGGKKDGFIDKSEASLDGNYNPADFKEGDEIQATILAVNKEYVSLSKKDVDTVRLEEAEAEKALAQGEFSLTMTEVVKGGLRGRLGQYTIFVPASQIRMGYVSNLEDYKGKTLRLTLMPPKEKENTEAEGEETAQSEDKPQKKSRYLFASQRIILEREKKEKEDLFWDNIHVHDIVTGKVKRFTQFGAFVNVRGFDCLAHISELSWKRIKHPSDVLKVGDVIDVYIKALDPEKKKISLGYRKDEDNPWEILRKNYPEGTVIDAEIVSLTDFGAFARVIPGIDGLIHISQIADRRIEKPSDVLKVGDKVQAKIIGIDFDKKRVSLSIRALLEPAAEDEAEETEAE